MVILEGDRIERGIGGKVVAGIEEGKGGNVKKV